MASSSTPLADYFWIAGVDSISYADDVLTAPAQVEETIAEDSEAEAVNALAKFSSKRASNLSRSSCQAAVNRLSQASVGSRNSVRR